MRFEKNRRGRRETVEIRIRSDKEPCLSMRIARRSKWRKRKRRGFWTESKRGPRGR